jgi:hypothetical protein
VTTEQDVVDAIAKRRIIRVSAKTMPDGSYRVMVTVPPSDFHPPDVMLALDVTEPLIAKLVTDTLSPFSMGTVRFLIEGTAPRLPDVV